MNSSTRITSILETKALDSAITGFKVFCLSQIKLNTAPNVQLPSNLRLGHLAERVVSELIKSSTNYEVLFENIQIENEGRTIGELDFIIRDLATSQLSHVELAYKFYLYDPHISDHVVANWIGPNRKDSLIEKLEKLKNHQFPLLYKESARESLDKLEIQKVDQALCLLASLFLPYNGNMNLSSIYSNNIKGYYLNVEAFHKLDHSHYRYYLPQKTEWGIDPSTNQSWLEYSEIQQRIALVSEEKQSLLCWKKQEEVYAQFFIIWW